MAEKKSLFEKIQLLLDDRRWRSESELTRLQRFANFWLLLGRSFIRNRCPIRASALSYVTLLALIPMLAVAISVTSSLLKEKGEEQIFRLLNKFISTVVPSMKVREDGPVSSTNSLLTGTSPLTNENPALMQTNFLSPTNLDGTLTLAPPSTNPAPVSRGSDQVITAQMEAAKKIHEFIQSTRSGALGVTGMVLLVVVAIRMLAHVESTFNDIWGVTRGRNWIYRIVLYWTTITLGPVLLIAALGLASGPHLDSTRSLVSGLPVLGPLIFPTLTLIVLWLTFALLYQLVPNTKVNFSAALVGGIVAGSLWHLNNLFGYLFASRVATNSTIYGSLFLIPVFMAGLYLTWFILLFGAQVAYAFQNRTLYLQERIAENVNQRGREFVALRLMTCIGQRFQRGQPPATIQDMSRELAIPSRLVQQVLHILIAAHLVIEVHGAEPGYTPARPLEDINAHHILQAMRATLGQELVTRDEPVRQEVYGEFARIQEAEKQAAASLSMLALVHRVQHRLELPETKTQAEEITMKPALVPTIEPVVPAQSTPIELDHSSAENAHEIIPEKIDQLHAPLEREPARPISEPAPGPVVESEKHLAGAPSTVATPSDEERDFPL